MWWNIFHTDIFIFLTNPSFLCSPPVWADHHNSKTAVFIFYEYCDRRKNLVFQIKTFSQLLSVLFKMRCWNLRTSFLTQRFAINAGCTLIIYNLLQDIFLLLIPLTHLDFLILPQYNSTTVFFSVWTVKKTSLLLNLEINGFACLSKPDSGQSESIKDISVPDSEDTFISDSNW